MPRSPKMIKRTPEEEAAIRERQAAEAAARAAQEEARRAALTPEQRAQEDARRAARNYEGVQADATIHWDSDGKPKAMLSNLPRFGGPGTRGIDPEALAAFIADLQEIQRRMTL